MEVYKGKGSLFMGVQIMKKIVCCLWSVCILTGCSQSKQEPLIAKKVPEINKQDLHNINTASLRRQFLQNPNKETKGNEYLYVIDKVELDGIDNYPLINNSSNEYYNWLTNYDIGKEINEHLYLNLQGDFAYELNQYFEDHYKTKTGGFVAQFIAGWVEHSNDILSLTVRNRNFAGDGMYKSQAIKVYNIDLNTNQPLTNEEVLSKFGLNFKQAQEIINKQLKKDHIGFCNNEYWNNCCYKKDITSMNGYYSPNLSSFISEDSILFVDVKNNLNMLIFVNAPEIAMYDGEVTNYYVIQLNK